MAQSGKAEQNIKAVDDIKRRLRDREITYDQALEEIAPIVDDINAYGREVAKRHGVKARSVSAREILR